MFVYRSALGIFIRHRFVKEGARKSRGYSGNIEHEVEILVQANA